MKKTQTVQEYIDSFPVAIRQKLSEIRTMIQSTASEAEESISYGMPAYKTFGKPLVYFAGYSGHIGFYATPTGHEAFADELIKYKTGKGSVQFPLDQPLPKDLIERIINFRIAENQSKYEKIK